MLFSNKCLSSNIKQVSHITFAHKISLQVSETKYLMITTSYQVSGTKLKYPCLMSLYVNFGQNTNSYYWDIADSYQLFLIPNFLITRLLRLTSSRGDFTPKNNP